MFSIYIRDRKIFGLELRGFYIARIFFFSSNRRALESSPPFIVFALITVLIPIRQIIFYRHQNVQILRILQFYHQVEIPIDDPYTIELI